MSTTVEVSPPLRVLFTTHPGLDTLDLTCPLEILSTAKHPATKRPIFTCLIASATPTTTTEQNLVLSRHLSLPEAYTALSTFDMLVVPGGNTGPVLQAGEEPMSMIRAFAALGGAGGKQRTILSVCSGSLFLAEAGVLKGKKAATHEIVRTTLEGYEGVEVLRERYVVNRRKEEGEVEIVTAGGVSCGLDASLFLVAEVAGAEEMERVAELVMYQWREGVVV